MDLIHTVTPHVTGFTGGSGDPSPATAVGVQHALGAVAERLWGSPDLTGRHVAVVGVGKVGGALARSLAAAGARVTVSDVRTDAAAALAAELGAAAVPAESALEVECDILAPCALGAVLSAATIPRLRCAAVCGAANNQLADDADAARLAAAGVLYAPDYIVNAGGVINIAVERAPGGYDHDVAYARIAGIADTLRRVFATADADGVDTAVAADRIAEARLAAATESPIGG
jgi:leucine dehydrogenase